jgi:segregation and condensation protein B
LTETGGAAVHAGRPAPSPAADEPDTHPVPAWVATAESEDLAPALEALCFALNRPLTLAEAAAVLGRAPAHVALAADVLSAALRGTGMMLQRHAEELQLVTRPEVAWAVHRALHPEKPGRLSRPALETLAIVAYRQPATRAVIEAIRGVNCDAVLDSLERRELVAEVGRADAPGHPRLFGTTLRFLQMVGLERIGDLPPMPEGMAVPDLVVDPVWEAGATDETDEEVVSGGQSDGDGPGPSPV